MVVSKTACAAHSESPWLSGRSLEIRSFAGRKKRMQVLRMRLELRGWLGGGLGWLFVSDELRHRHADSGGDLLDRVDARVLQIASLDLPCVTRRQTCGLVDLNEGQISLLSSLSNAFTDHV
jgi:hypothetical protein